MMASGTSKPGTPEWTSSLSRELESVIAERNLLTTRTRRKVIDDLKEVAGQAEESDMERLRRKAVDEVISSEKTYLNHLETVDEYFLRPIKERGLLPNSDFATIFGDLPSIIQVNKELLAALEASDDRIGRVFLELAPYLKFYSTYANDFQSAVKLVEYWTGKNKQFRLLVRDQESRPEVAHKLNALLITPIQRIPRYKLLLEDVVRTTPDQHPDKASLSAALEQIEAVAWHINEQLREHENNMRMVDIQRSLSGGFPNIVAPGRKLLKQGSLMKVPRTGCSGGQARYFALFSDMVMYCKIRSCKLSDGLQLPRANSLECGCMLPLKLCRVETLVGRGVFKLTCRREELILYSNDGSQSSEEWVDAITKAIAQHKANSATLRKESSRRDPIKRPDIMKMRRESLGQILLLRKGILATPGGKHKMTLRDRKEAGLSPGNSPIVFSPRKRPAPSTPSQPKVSTSAEDSTPKRARTDMGPPEVDNVQLRGQKVKRQNRATSSWKTLSLTRRAKAKSVASADCQMFSSPSIFADSSNRGDVIMDKYLSEQFGPLTPSQKPTNISHLVSDQPRTEAENCQPASAPADPGQTAVVPASAGQLSGGFCCIM